MCINILTNYNEVKKHLDTVIKNADDNSKCLGFFPPTMYEQLAEKGGLWVLTDNDHYIGHLLFSISWRTYKITINQIYIIPQKQRNGFAKKLIDRIKQYGEQNNIIDITAKVASDLDKANNFYEIMGFHLVTQEKGGNSTKRILNIRKYNLPNLLTSVNSRMCLKLPQTILESDAYVLDTNLILDFLENRQWKESVEKLFKKAFEGIISLHISNETKRELLSKHTSDDDSCVELLKALPVLNPPKKDFLITTESIVQFIFGKINPSSNSSKNKIADAKHIQEAIFNRCGGFITRDAHLLKKSVDIFNKYGVEIVSIDEFINTDVIDSNEFSKIYFKVQDETFKLDLDNKYIIHELPNEIFSFHETLKKRFKNSQIHKLSILSENELLAFTLWGNSLRKKGQLDIFLFLHPFEGASTLFEKIITYIKRFACQSQVETLSLHFLQGDISKFSSLLNQHFFYEVSEDGERVFKRVFFEQIINSNNWSNFITKFNTLYNTSISERLLEYSILKRNGIQIKEKQCYDFNEFENIISPSIIVPKGRPIAIIPIKENFAADFFSFSATKQLSLDLYPKRETFLSDKKVYFRTPDKVENIVNGAIILFYVSRPYSSIVGFAKIKRILTVHLKDVQEEERKFGVIEENNLKKISKRGLIQFIVFENFVSFNKAISLKKLKEIGIGKANFIRPESISVENFKKIYFLQY